MWFGTYDGLNIYDGYGFKIFRNRINDSTSLIHNLVTVIHEDNLHKLWVGTRRGLCQFNSLTGKFSYISIDVGKGLKNPKVTTTIREIKEDKRNDILVGTAQGLLLCKPGSLAARSIPLMVQGKNLQTYSVSSIATEIETGALVLIENMGLCMFDYESGKLKLINTAIKDGISMVSDGESILISTAKAVYKYNITSNDISLIVEVPERSLNSGIIKTMVIDKDHHLWVGMDGGGVCHYDMRTRKMELFTEGDSKNHLTSGSVEVIYVDRENRKWIGTLRGGINILNTNPGNFQAFAHDPLDPRSLKGKFISSFCEDPQNKLWIGTEGAGVNLWDRNSNTFTNYAHNPADPGSLSGNFITSIAKDHDHLIWVATYFSGLNRFNKTSGRFEHYPLINPYTGNENKTVFTLYSDRENNLWAGTLQVNEKMGGLFRFVNEKNQFELFDSTLSFLLCINEDRKGNLWGGIRDQLVKIDRKNKQHRFYNIGFIVRALYEDSYGNFWVGTEDGGLLLLDTSNGHILARYTTEQGLCNNAVLNILEDKQGCLWLGTINGLARFSIRDRTFKNYYQSDGLQTTQFNYNAFLALQSGELVFGGIHGFSIFRPESFVNKANLPGLYITGITINNVPVEQEASLITKSTNDVITEIKVPYNKAVFSFDFVATEYTAPNKIQYAYYMESWDRGWNYSRNSRTATYTHLSEGSYTFRVKCTNAEGEWSSTEKSLKIIVLPPWYRSWWAYALYLLMVGGAIVLYQRYRIYRTRLKYEIDLANLNADKQRAEYHRKEAELKTERAEGEKKEAELAKERAEREFKEAELAREQAERETERVINEKEKEVNEKKLSFFTHVSHEFRTPLSLIINPIKDILQKNKEDEATPDGELPVIYRNARRLLSMVDQLLLFRKAESGMDLIKPSRINICSFCKEVYLCFVQQAKAKDIAYQFECSPEYLELYADPQKLEIILYNLLSNALKYTPYGGSIWLRITENEQEVEIVVEDTGSGISRQVGDRLFDKYYQPDRKDAPAKTGFGIGLYLVKQFTEQHKGKISYLSEEAKGTSFTLQLLKGKEHFESETIIGEDVTESFLLQQLKEETEVGEMKAFEEKGSPIEEVVTDKQTILVIDDDEQTLQYLVQQFKEQYIVYQADRGEEGIRLARLYLPDLIISDVHMHGISGIDLCKTIKEDAALGHIPVILLTASSSDDVKLQGVEGGADDYITKPFDNKLLIARVVNLLKGRNNLQKYFYNEITLNKSDLKISAEYKEFLERCISIVEGHLEDDNFGVKTLMSEMGMSHSNLFRKVKSVSGQSINVFIRCIRLRKAAELFINTGYNVNETAFMVGFQHQKYFRHQFHKLFGLNPSDYIKKYRKAYGKQFTVQKDSLNPENLKNK